jgi:truncated hemoglobin YjbI/pimeloyl-ACP methyl ester carboxylesterase
VAGKLLDGWLVIDLDATLITARSPAPTFNRKKGYGFHPLGAWLANTTESLAMLLRPGNAGSSTVADHIAVLAAAVRQIPARFRSRLLVRVDGAGASHELIAHLLSLAGRRRTVLFTCGWAITGADEQAIRLLPATAWQAAVDQDGTVQENRHVAEVTHLMSRAVGWPAGLRWIVRRTKPSRRQMKNLTAFERSAGWRYSDIDREITPAALASDVAGLLAIDRARIFGHSMGGAATLELGINHPDRVRSRVPASASVRPDGLHEDLTDPARQATSARLPTQQDFLDFQEAYQRLSPHPDHFNDFLTTLSQSTADTQGWPGRAARRHHRADLARARRPRLHHCRARRPDAAADPRLAARRAARHHPHAGDQARRPAPADAGPVPGLRSAQHCGTCAIASRRHAAAQLTFADYNTRCPEDLHTICTRSASLLHARELRCYVTKGEARGGGIGGMVWLRQAGAILLTSKAVRTLPVTLSSVRAVTSAGPRRPSRQKQSNGLTRRFKGEQMTTQTKSLYDRLGGLDAINAAVDSWVARVAGDDRINRKFERTDIPRLKKEVVDQLCEATGGPCTYTGRSMPDTHAGMKTTAGEFDAVMQDLGAVLDEFKVPKTEQDELVDLLMPMRGDIVEVESPETGTPLPDSYQAAPPLR